MEPLESDVPRITFISEPASAKVAGIAVVPVMPSLACGCSCAVAGVVAAGAAVAVGVVGDAAGVCGGSAGVASCRARFREPLPRPGDLPATEGGRRDGF